MKILEMNLKKGFVKVVPETLDDLWHLYNIVYRGDEVYARTTREIKPDEKYARPRRGQRVPVLHLRGAGDAEQRRAAGDRPGRRPAAGGGLPGVDPVRRGVRQDRCGPHR